MSCSVWYFSILFIFIKVTLLTPGQSSIFRFPKGHQSYPENMWVDISHESTSNHKYNRVTKHSNLYAYRMGYIPLIARFMGPIWGPPGADRTQMGPMLAPWTLLSGSLLLPWQQWWIAIVRHNIHSRVYLCIISVATSYATSHWKITSL